MPMEGGNVSGGIGWTVPSLGSEAQSPYVQPSIRPQGEPDCVPSAPPPDGGEKYKQPHMPFHGSTALSYPDIRMYKSLKIMFLMLCASIVTVSVCIKGCKNVPMNIFCIPYFSVCLFQV